MVAYREGFEGIKEMSDKEKVPRDSDANDVYIPEVSAKAILCNTGVRQTYSDDPYLPISAYE